MDLSLEFLDIFFLKLSQVWGIWFLYFGVEGTSYGYGLFGLWWIVQRGF